MSEEQKSKTKTGQGRPCFEAFSSIPGFFGDTACLFTIMAEMETVLIGCMTSRNCQCSFVFGITRKVAGCTALTGMYMHYN